MAINCQLGFHGLCAFDFLACESHTFLAYVCLLVAWLASWLCFCIMTILKCRRSVGWCCCAPLRTPRLLRNWFMPVRRAYFLILLRIAARHEGKWLHMHVPQRGAWTLLRQLHGSTERNSFFTACDGCWGLWLQWYLRWRHKSKLILDVTPPELFSQWPYSNGKLLPSRNELTLKDLASYLQCLILDWFDHQGMMLFQARCITRLAGYRDLTTVTCSES